MAKRGRPKKLIGPLQTLPDGAKPAGETLSRTAEQEAAFNKFIELMRNDESKGDKVHIKLAWVRGLNAKKLLGDQDTYGKVSTAEVADLLDINKQVLNRCMKFFGFVNKDDIDKLCNMQPKPPSWQMMNAWAGIKDEAKRNDIYGSIMSGQVKSFKEFSILLRAGSTKAPRTRKLSDPSKALTKLDASSATMITQLEWIPKVKSLYELADSTAKDKIADTAKKAVVNMKTLMARLDAAITECESIVE